MLDRDFLPAAGTWSHPEMTVTPHCFLLADLPRRCPVFGPLYSECPTPLTPRKLTSWAVLVGIGTYPASNHTPLVPSINDLKQAQNMG